MIVSIGGWSWELGACRHSCGKVWVNVISDRETRYELRDTRTQGIKGYMYYMCVGDRSECILRARLEAWVELDVGVQWQG